MQRITKKEITIDNIPQDNANKRKESEKHQTLHNVSDIALKIEKNS